VVHAGHPKSMSRERNFLLITAADFLARSAYQMGKTPLLPIFAATLGATGAFLGIIVSVSTLTGMILKPFIGLFSDRWGRRNWLILGTAFFALMPFTYRFVTDPDQLLAIRILHGMATAIYGPVTLAYVVELVHDRRAERLGVFSMARSAGYIVGPAAAGWMLLSMDAIAVFTIIGVLSSFAFIPILALPESDLRIKDGGDLPGLINHMRRAFKSASQSPAIWLSGSLQAATYVALYATKAFLPVYALAQGVNVAVVGTFFALQEATLMICKPRGGRLGDRHGYRKAIAGGMFVLGILLPLVPLVQGTTGLFGLAILMGAAQATIFPSTTALVARQILGMDLGAAMGIVGTLGNAGKVIGPIMGGVFIRWLDYSTTFLLLGAMLLAGAAFIWLGAYASPRASHRSQADRI
jgi:MFS family permease